MAFKACPPPTFSPSTSDYNQFSDWRKEFEIYMAVTTFFATEVNLPVQHAWLFNLAGQDFSKFCSSAHDCGGRDNYCTNIGWSWATVLNLSVTTFKIGSGCLPTDSFRILLQNFLMSCGIYMISPTMAPI